MDNSKLFKSFAKGKKTLQLLSDDCVVYTRVSGAKQMDGLSLETQLKGVLEYAKRNKLLVREQFGGTYESAQSDERKEFQRMIKYLKTTKYKISKILVYSLERFSRNENSIWLSSQLRKLGTEIVSVTQPIDTTNPGGIMQQKILFLFGEFDNSLRRQKSMAGVKERLLKGEWCAKPPIGYDILKRNGERKIILNEQSKIIKKIFLWKAERLQNEEIRKRLLNLKVNFCLRRIGEILTNPFYCGMMVHKALEGDVLEGKHEKLITKEMFLSVNGILAEKKLGLQVRKERPEIALKRFMFCEGCKEPMRGYVANSCDTPYYKCNTPGCKCNRNAEEVNKKFGYILSGHSVNVKYVKLIEYKLKQTFTKMNASVEENQSAAKAKMNDLNKKIERLEERYILEEITGELYGKYKEKFEKERDEIEAQIKKNRIEMSKLDDYISVSLNYAVNLSKMWASGDYTQRQELQNAFFPKGITYNRKKDSCRSIEVNDFLAESAQLSGRLATFAPDKLKNFKLTSVSAT
jgi:DNA invertase Pin-like site-specific DNA recombinase